MESNSAIVNAIVSWIAYELWNSHEQTHSVHFKWFTKFHSLFVLSSVNTHRCAYKFCRCTFMCSWVCQCTIMCSWVCQCTFMCSWVLLVHICILMGCQYIPMLLQFLSLHIHMVMSSVNAQHCNSE